MRKQIKKAIATITLGAFSVMTCVPAYANNIELSNQNIQMNNCQEIKIEYNENGKLEKEIVQLGEMIIYRIIDDNSSIAILLNSDGTGDVAINNNYEDGHIEYGYFNMSNRLGSKSTISMIDNNEIEKLFSEIAMKAETGEIELETLDLVTNASIYAVPANHYNAIYAEMEDTEEDECTNRFLTSKSTTNIRASLYQTVEYRINNKANIPLAAGLALTTVLTLFSLPSKLVQAVLTFVNVGGTLVLSQDSTLSEYQVTVAELKSVKCDGHVDYDGLRSNHGHAAVGDNGGSLSVAIEYYDEDYTCDETLFHDNNALLDKGIDLHQRLCL